MSYQGVWMGLPFVMHHFPKLVVEGATRGTHVVVLALPLAVDDVILEVGCDVIVGQLSGLKPLAGLHVLHRLALEGKKKSFECFPPKILDLRESPIKRVNFPDILNFYYLFDQILRIF